jgi:hypothetical protein
MPPRSPGRQPLALACYWSNLVAGWLTDYTPRAFRFLRSRWTCAVVVVLLWHGYQLALSRETVRRWLHQAGLV